MKQTILTYITFLFLVFGPMSASAQMFSVDDNEQRRSNPFSSYLRGGIQIINFEYQGDPNEDLQLAFNGTVAHLAFESGGFDIGASFGNDLIGLDHRNYFDLNLNFTNPFYVIQEPNFSLGVPVKLSTKLTSVRSDTINNIFSQTNLSAGAGAIAQFIFPEKLGASVHFIPSIGFSTASGGFIGGNAFSMRGKARIHFYNLIFGRNLSLGYDYIYDSYNIDGEEFDYDLTGHLLTLGISL